MSRSLRAERYPGLAWFKASCRKPGPALGLVVMVGPQLDSNDRGRGTYAEVTTFLITLRRNVVGSNRPRPTSVLMARGNE
ncbi:hypothetical protein MM1218R_00032 [Mycobacterium marinum]|nr:hypothetical protein MM1218R_00032 [Mycobacterium marinum]RFZ04337.1 hypothetical protein DE4381_04076 [Mycobacterium marinum]RFZ23901.1 hypothetical protein DSM44344_03031 [Mycobacterium marinum]RFZ27187.1 hypothetical protein DSM43519_00996 [Mycobacterium marinum]RFZ39562.1 hypothetical protein NCTC2275_00065 [Mycobacterium marinum]